MYIKAKSNSVVKLNGWIKSFASEIQYAVLVHVINEIIKNEAFHTNENRSPTPSERQENYKFNAKQKQKSFKNLSQIYFKAIYSKHVCSKHSFTRHMLYE